MQTRVLSRAGVEVSVIGFGCGPGARLMVGDDASLQLQAVQAAFGVGIDYFDTAAGYGDGRSETNLGRALNMMSSKAVISTKVVLEANDLGDIDAAIRTSVAASLARLGVDRVDALILHNRVARTSEFPKPPGSGVLLHLPEVFGPGGVVETFQHLLDQELVGSVGFTAFGGEQAAIDEMIASGIFTSMNAAFNVLNPSANIAVPPDFGDVDYGGVIRRASAAGLGVMAIRVLAGGALGTQSTADPRIADLSALAKDARCSVHELAIRFVLSTEGVQTAILGLSEIDHVRAAAVAAEAGPLDPELYRRIEQLSLTNASG